MRTLWNGLLIGGILLLCGPAARADNNADAKALLDKALKAMGGEEKVAKLKMGSTRGKVTGSAGGQNLELVLAATWKDTDKLHLDADVNEGGQMHKAVFVINADKGWMKRDGGEAMDAPPGVTEAVLSVVHAVRMPQLLSALRGDAYKLAPVGEAQVNGKPAVGISVSRDGYKQINLYFDKETGLPAKCETTIMEPGGGERKFEFTFTDYKELAGVKHPAKIEIKTNDDTFTGEMSELKAEEKVEDTLFNKP
jgi:hypothetical protein